MNLNENIQGVLEAQNWQAYLPADVLCDLTSFVDELPMGLSADGLVWMTPSGEFGALEQSISDMTIGDEVAFALVCGVGNRALLKALIDQASIQQILIYEPSVAFLRASLDLPEFASIVQSKKVGFIFGRNQTALSNQLERYFHADVSRMYAAGNHQILKPKSVCLIPGYEACFESFLQTFSMALEAVEVSPFEYVTEDTYRGFINAVRAMPAYQHFAPIDQLSGSFKDMSAIVVGSGPSLKLGLPYLQKIKDEVLIVACDSTLKPLLDAGIEPHFCVVLERVSETKHLFEGLPNQLRTVLVSLSVVHPAAYDLFPGPKMSLARTAGPDEWLYPDRARHWVGQSAGHMGVKVASILGARDVYLMGFDSSYDPHSGASHAGGVSDFVTVNGQWEKSKNTRVQKYKAQGYDGLERETTIFWHANTLFFGQMMRRENLRLTNVMPSAYGLPMEDLFHLEPEHLISRVQTATQPVFQILAEAQKGLSIQHPDSSKLMKETLDGLEWTAAQALQQMQIVADVWLEYDPCVASSLPIYHKFFFEMAQLQLKLMAHPSGVFKKIIVHLLQEFFIQNGFLINKCVAEFTDPSLRYRRMLMLTIEWYQKVHSATSRVAALIHQESGTA